MSRVKVGMSPSSGSGCSATSATSAAPPASEASRAPRLAPPWQQEGRPAASSPGSSHEGDTHSPAGMAIEPQDGAVAEVEHEAPAAGRPLRRSMASGST
jgi:hypothetical protein